MANGLCEPTQRAVGEYAVPEELLPQFVAATYMNPMSIETMPMTSKTCACERRAGFLTLIAPTITPTMPKQNSVARINSTTFTPASLTVSHSDRTTM